MAERPRISGTQGAQLVTTNVLFCDVVDSTRSRAQIGDPAAEELRRSVDRIVRRSVHAGGGRFVKHLGDGAMAVFDSASGAIIAASLMQRSAGHLGAWNGDHFAGLRVGISAGDTEIDAGDHFGMPVVEAARLCAAADSGHVLVADIVTSLAGSRLDHVFTDRTALDLKGIPGRVTAAGVDLDRVPSPLSAIPDGLGSSPQELVGRDGELDMIMADWSRVVAGAAAAIRVQGAPGIGKTALLGAAVDRMQPDAPAVLFAQGEDGSPTLTNMFEGASSVEWVEELVAHAECAPVAMLVDDIDKADDTTWATVAGIAGDRPPGVLLLTTTTSLDDAAWPGRTVRLSGIDEPATRLLMESMVGARRLDELSLSHEEVHVRAGGHPMLVREIVAALARDEEPEFTRGDVTSFIRQRCAGLDRSTLDLLHIAATIGTQFEAEPAAEVAGVPVATALEQLEAAETAGIITATPAGTLAFRHGITAEVLVADMTELRRQGIHASIASALQRRSTAISAQRVVHHLSMAGAAASPIDLATWTAAAVRQHSTALETEIVDEMCGLASQRLRRAPDSAEARRADLDLRIARAALGRAHAEPRWRARLRSLALEADREHEPALCIAAVMEMSRGVVSAALSVDEDYVALLSRSLDHARASGDRRAEATMLGLLAVEQVHTLPLEDRQRLSDHALAIEDTIGDRRLRLRLLLARYTALDCARNHLDLRRTIAEARRLVAESDDPSEHFWTSLYSRLDALLHGEADAAARFAEEARRNSDGSTESQWHIDLMEVHDTILAGRLGVAESMSTAACERATEYADAELARLGQLLLIRREQGRLDEMTDGLDEGLESIGRQAFGKVLQATSLTAGGDRNASRSIVETVLDHVPFHDDSFWLLTMFLLAETVAEVAPERAEALIEPLEPYADLIAGVSVASLGPVRLVLGQLRLAAGDSAGAQRELTKARDIAEAFAATSWATAAQDGLLEIEQSSLRL